MPAPSIAEFYGVSADHMGKATKWLTQAGYCTALRGSQGGVQLARSPSEVVVGEVVRASEPAGKLLACFTAGESDCPLLPGCALKGALARAEQAFYAVLHGYTLSDLLAPPAGSSAQLELGRRR